MAAAISQQTNHAPEAMANAIAPTIGRAIKEQIHLETVSMATPLRCHGTDRSHCQPLTKS
ncbi:MAG: hypothetical protein H7Z11_10450 [Verrucomicrobia bacterium]|nr:hypothetical protein [Leptolyngbya sp. ES-bin-22]